MEENINPINIRILGECSIINRTLDDGTSLEKRVSTADLCSALGDQVKEYFTFLPEFCRGVYERGDTVTLLFIYPPNKIRHTILDWDRERRFRPELRLGEFPDNIPTESDIESIIGGNPNVGSAETIKNRYRAFDIPYPATIVITVLSKNSTGYRLNNQYVFATKYLANKLRDLELYRYPFTNVYGDDHCCLGGGIGSLSVDSLEYCSVFPTLIFNGIGNTDLTGSTNLNRKGPLKWGALRDEYDLITKISGLTEFPVEYLKPLSTTLVERFKEIGGN